MAHFADTLEQNALAKPLGKESCLNYIILQRLGDSAAILFSICVSSYKNRCLAPNYMQVRVSLPEILLVMPENDHVLHVLIGVTRRRFHSCCS